MRTRTWIRALCALSILSLIAAACGDDDTDNAGSATTETTAPAPVPEEPEAPEAETEEAEAPAETEEPDVPAETEPAIDPLDLASVCPDPIVIQTDWFPESEHGAMYQMMGSDYTLDTDNMITTGTLMAGETDTGVDIEIRAGGPAIGFASGPARLYLDTDIHLAYVSIDQAVILNADTPTLSVVAPLEKNPQIIQWDPATYPDIESIADVGEAGIVVNVFGGGTFINVFVNEGVLSADQIDPSYDGSPARFIAEGGAIAQQGFASESPYSYEVAYEEWSKPIAFELIHDAGLQIYSQTLAMRPADLDGMRPCLENFVPIVQQSVVDFAADSARANAIIVDVVERIGSFWQYSPELAEFSVDTQKDLGLIGNGPDGTVGNMEESRIADVIAKIVGADFDVDASMQPSDITTNEFIDEGIGF